jgi:tricarballylate dehydrogenase
MDAQGAPDVLVAGGGIAALCAALAARHAGASVLLAEQAPKALRGGNLRHARNLRIMHEAPSPLSPDAYGEAEFLSDLRQASGGFGDESLARLLVRRSAGLPQWLEAHGVAFQSPAAGALPYSRKTMFLLGGGMAMLNALYRTARKMGVRIAYDCDVTSLNPDGSAEVNFAGRPLTIASRAAIACSGGYQANRAWLRQEFGDAAENFAIRGTAFAVGGLLRLLLDGGAAAVGKPGACHLVAVDARSPAFDGGIVSRVDGFRFGLVVDRNGHRFHDEDEWSGPTRYSAWGREIAARPGQIAFLILDASGVERAPPSVFPAIIVESFAEMASLPGVDAENFVKNVTQNNRVKTPPFHVFPIRPGVTFTCRGLKVDEAAHIVTTEGAPSPALFAAGLIMAPNLLWTGYLAGVALTIGAVFGLIAGEGAARHAQS